MPAITPQTGFGLRLNRYISAWNNFSSSAPYAEHLSRKQCKQTALRLIRQALQDLGISVDIFESRATFEPHSERIRQYLGLGPREITNLFSFASFWQTFRQLKKAEPLPFEETQELAMEEPEKGSNPNKLLRFRSGGQKGGIPHTLG